MAEMKRPKISLERDIGPVEAFIQGLQNAIDTGDADAFNLQFADDVLWGSPFGAIAVGYDQIHAIHARMFASVKPFKGASKYSIEQVRFPKDDVAIAYVRRLSRRPPAAPPSSDLPGSFDELALLVLVLREGRWWLSAGQHVPDRREIYAGQKPHEASSAATDTE